MQIHLKNDQKGPIDDMSSPDRLPDLLFRMCAPDIFS